MTSIHPTAAQGFVRADVYERGRPEYPAQTVEALGITATDTVVDLGCGTGKFTRILEGTEARVVGIEPLPAMLEAFREQMPGVSSVAGIAESMPLATACADVVVCASAFHWFHYDRALHEIHRVLRPGGRLGIVWNRRDELSGWAAGFWSITEAYRGDTPGYRTGIWRDTLEASRLFGPITEHWFDNVQQLDLEGMLARVESTSFIEMLPAGEHRLVLEDCRMFLKFHPETRGREVFDLPYRTAVYVCERC
ncbi:MAG: class I SAM-dependent methyltransferase [Actinomycetota bacterium]